MIAAIKSLQSTLQSAVKNSFILYYDKLTKVEEWVFSRLSIERVLCYLFLTLFSYISELLFNKIKIANINESICIHNFLQYPLRIEGKIGIKMTMFSNMPEISVYINLAVF